MADCEHCGDGGNKKHVSNDELCIECLAVREMQLLTRKPLTILTEDEYNTLRGWQTVLSRVRKGRDPIPDNNDAYWKSEPDVPRRVVSAIAEA
jgi:hypothetical protein